MDVKIYGKEYSKLVESVFQYDFTVNSEDAGGTYLKIIKEILEYSVYGNMFLTSTSDEGYMPLHHAIKNQQGEAAKLLIRYGADVNVRDKTGRSPLWYAIENGDLKIIKLLLTKNANVKDNPELLNIAVKNECREIVEVLLQQGVDVNASNKCGRTALHFTASGRSKSSKFCQNLGINLNSEIAKLLLNNGANVNAQTKNGETSLHAVSQIGYKKVIEVLLEYNADVNLRDKTKRRKECGRTALHIAARQGYLGIVEVLLKFGAEINSEGKYGKTPLHYAADNGHLDVIKVLLKFGAEINSEGKYGDTPLHYAAENGHLEVLEVLVKFGANINSEGRYHKTPLHYATRYGHLDVVEFLLKFGAKIDSKDDFGKTPLIIAARGHLGIVNVLLKAGADIDSKAGAVTRHNLKIIEILLTFGARIECKGKLGQSPLHIAAIRDYLEIVMILLKFGASIDSKTETGVTPLHYAAENGHLELVKVFLQCGASIDDSKDEAGETPFHCAAKHGHVEVVEFLLKFGACIDAKARNGETALHIACRACETEVVAVLLEHGFDVNIMCEKNRTPLNSAERKTFCYYGNKSNCETVKILKHHIVKLKIANLYVSNKNLLSIDGDYERTKLQKKCEKEIGSMKDMKIGNSNVSFYDILTRNIMQLATLFKNDSIMQIVRSYDYKMKFPLYADIMSRHIREGERKMELLEQVNEHCIPVFAELPWHCIRKVLNFQNDIDLKNLINACRSINVDDVPVIASMPPN